MWRYILLSMMLGTFEAGAGMAIVCDGKPQAEIVVAAQADATEQFAAQELQYWVKKISGAELPVVKTIAGDNRKIYIGKAFAGKYDADLAALKGTEGFAVRNDGKNIYIFGAVPKGTLCGIADFIERNTDLIWARPADFGTIFTPVAMLAVNQADYREIPVFAIRGWHICSIWQHSHEPTELWMVRNGCNYILSSGHNDLLSRRLKYGFEIEFGGGHNINSYYMPAKKYFEKHPEFYCQIDGKRRPGSRENQLCFTNTEMTAAFTGELLEKIRNSPNYVKVFNVMIEDNWNVCECVECVKPIRLPDGSLLDPKDEVFRSTQFFMFLNKLAEEIYKKYPDKRITAYGYIFTAPAPKIKLFKNINIMYCPFVKNDKFSMDSKANAKWKKSTEDWAKVTKNVMVYEYYGCASKFPRPMAEIAAADMKFLNSLGFNQLFSEFVADTATDTHSDWNWDASAMDFWVISRLYRNPNQDVETLRKYYLTRAYQQAAPAMERYYAEIRKSWFDSNAPSFYNDSEIKSAAMYILKKGLEKICREALAEAETKANQPNIKTMVQRQRIRFEEWIKDAKAQSTTEATVPYVKDAASGIVNIDQAIWSHAVQLDDLKIMGNAKQKADPQTVIKLMHDRKNLYIALKCIDRNPNSLYAMPYPQPVEKWTKGDHCELFFDGDQKDQGSYFYFSFDCNGNMYDAKGFDNKWNSRWSSSIRKTADGWNAVITIPLADIGVNVSQNNIVRGLFYRQFSHNRPDNQHVHSSWNGGPVHQVTGFGILTLAME